MHGTNLTLPGRSPFNFEPQERGPAVCEIWVPEALWNSGRFLPEEPDCAAINQGGVSDLLHSGSEFASPVNSLALRRILVVQCQGRCFRPFALLLGDEFPKFLGVANDRTGMGVFRRPSTRVLAQAVNI